MEFRLKSPSLSGFGRAGSTQRVHGCTTQDAGHDRVQNSPVENLNAEHEKVAKLGKVLSQVSSFTISEIDESTHFCALHVGAGWTARTAHLR